MMMAGMTQDDSVKGCSSGVLSPLFRVTGLPNPASPLPSSNIGLGLNVNSVAPA